MKTLETLKISDAVGRKNKFFRPRTHLTTMEIGQLQVLMHEDLNPGDSVTVDESIFSRLAPLAVPTYGSFYFKTATFFVDYYQLFAGAEGFFSGKVTTRGIAVKLPTITKGELFNFFSNSLISSPVLPADVHTSADYDFRAKNNATTSYYRFTALGRWIYKVVRSLGYQIPEIISATSSFSASPNYNDKLSALPLLAFFKAYNDYMSQAQRFDTSTLTLKLENVRLNKTQNNWFDSSNGAIKSAGLVEAFQSVYVQYESDYFTSCWSSPNNPIGDISTDVSSISAPISSSEFQSITSNTNNTYFSPYLNNITQRSLDFLRSFDNYIRRNNYSGSKDVEKIFSRFGIKPDFYKANYAHLVSTSSNEVAVGDVTSLTDSLSTANNSGAVLGEYAGKGIVNGDNKFTYRADDFGILITVGWITVKPVYSNGYDRAVLRTNPLDWYNPEFDGLGGNPVSVGEVFVDRKSLSSTVNENKIFGFNERYDEYKTGNLDQITGDFCLFDDMESWHFDRTDLSALQSSGTLNAQTLSFNSLNAYVGSNYRNFYNRIFNSEAGVNNTDHFYVSAHFNVVKYSNMKNMNQVPALGEGSLTVQRNGSSLN